jgi:hypothetical protein
MNEPNTPAEIGTTNADLTELLNRVKTGACDSPFEEILEPQKRAFLCAYALTGVKVRACKAVGIHPTTIYTDQWAKDEAFMAAQDRARIMSADVLEAEAHRRAVEGWVEPVGWYKGVAGGTVRRYSDVLLIFTLKGALPDRYRDRVDVRATLANLDVSRLPDDLVSRLAAGENPLTVLAPILAPKALPAPPEGQDMDDSGGI